MAGKRVKTYSKGMRQRLGFAQAILGTPRLLILDEPTGGLDPESRQAFYKTLHELAGRGAAIILSSHVLTEVEAGTDRIAIMRDGRLSALGTADELKRRAGLAVTIRVAVRPGGGARLASALGGRSSERINDHAVELRCTAGEKRALIERILGLGDEVEDIEIVPPGLDEVYARFGGSEQRREGARAVTAVASHRRARGPRRHPQPLDARRSAAPRRAGADAGLRGQRRRAGQVAASPLAITVVSLSSLSVFLVPLIGLLVSYDTLVGEIERGTMPLLMTHPVTRLRIVLGKFAGQVAILAIATVVGFGVAALVTGLGEGGDAEAWIAFGTMVGGSILLGAAFIALGTLISAVVAERGTAAGVSAAAWLVFVVLFDMALLADARGGRGAGGLGRSLPRAAAAQPDRRVPHADARGFRDRGARSPAWRG